MSLFTAQQWWEATLNEDAADMTTLPQTDLLACATHSGLLRIFKPERNQYQPQHLVLEQNLQQPILQMKIGAFTNVQAQKDAIALLHPKSLAVYSLKKTTEKQLQISDDEIQGSQIASTGYYTLVLAYKVQFETPCCNMTAGRFGGSMNAEGICIQSMDGVVSLIEMERVSREKQLTNFLLPGPLHYCNTTDSFYTLNAQLAIDCYRYSTLSGVSLGIERVAERERAKPDWSTCIGEDVVSIISGRTSSNLSLQQAEIIIIGDRSIHALDLSGSLRKQLRLNYSASCGQLYPSPLSSGPDMNLLVGSHTGSLMIYQDFKLIWATRLPAPARCLNVGTFGGVRGLIASFSFKGQISLSFLGTQPPTASAVAETKELDYESMEAEHCRLLKSIRDSSSGSGKREPADAIKLSASLARRPAAGEEQHWPLTVTINVTNPGSPRKNVSLVASCTSPFYLAADSVTLPSLGGSGATAPVPFIFRARPEELPIDMHAQVVATYSRSEVAESHCVRCEFVLPLCMVAQVCPLVRTAKYKVTLETGGARVPQLVDWFADIPRSDDATTEQANAPAISIRYNCGLEVSLLQSKNAGRLRVQSHEFEGIWLIADQVYRRVIASDPSAKISSSEPIPLKEYFEAVDEHLRCRHELASARSDLEKCSHQMRIIEKRLLVRLKDRNPSPLTNLQLLCDGTHSQIMAIADAADRCKTNFEFHSRRLSASTRLILLLLRARYSLNDEDMELLEAHLSPIDIDTVNQGWEERTTAALIHLLRTSLSKSGQNEVGQNNLQQLTLPDDSEKFKKHLTLVCDRLERGFRPTGERHEQPIEGA